MKPIVRMKIPNINSQFQKRKIRFGSNNILQILHLLNNKGENIVKLSKKAKTKIIVAVLAVCLAVFGAYKFVDTYSHSYAESKAINYLCQKYDEDASAFEVLDYQQSGYARRDTGQIIGERVWINFSFEVKYKEKSFFVKKYKGKYYDDYQLEDIEKWGTDWLKNNVDKRFTGFDFSSDDIIQYQKAQRKRNKYIIKQSDAEEIISFIANNDKEKNDRLSNFYYQGDSSDNEITANELSSKLIKKFKFNETPLFTDCDTVEVFIYKQSKYNNFDVYEWTRRMMGSVWRN